MYSSMSRKASLPTLAKLELSQSVYDEIERKLLEAGHEHRFWDGPGTAIDMTGIWVERRAQPTDLEMQAAADREQAIKRVRERAEQRGDLPRRTCLTCGAAVDPEDVEARNVQAHKVAEQKLSALRAERGQGFKITPDMPIDSRYCFGCDRMVTQPCERVDCMEAANREAASSDV